MIDIVVSTKGNLDLTRRSIESLYANTKDFRLIAIDNNSSDIRNFGYLQSVADVVIRHNEDVSLAEAWNRGVGCSQSDYIVITCNDIFYSPDWLSNLVKWYEKEKSIGTIQPYSTLSGIPEDFPNNFVPVSVVLPILSSQFIGSCFMFSREVYDRIAYAQEQIVGKRVGGFDNRYFPLGIEDHDFCMMARKLGYRNLTAYDSYIHHITGGTVSKIMTHDERESARNKNVELFKSKFDVKNTFHVSKLWQNSPIDSSHRLVCVRDFTDAVDYYLVVPPDMNLDDEKESFKLAKSLGTTLYSFRDWLIARGARESLEGDIEFVEIT